MGYAAGNTFKSVQYVVTNLIDIVSKNGNLLLNIGPRSDGTITEEETNVLLGTGKWLNVNGEAIYGTRPWKVFGEGPTESASGSLQTRRFLLMPKTSVLLLKAKPCMQLLWVCQQKILTINSLWLKAGQWQNRFGKMVGTQPVKWKQQDDALVIEPFKTTRRQMLLFTKLNLLNNMRVLLVIAVLFFSLAVFSQVAQTPPMGWNSYNCFGSAVHEDEVKGNADYMAARLKQYGWQYIVVDFLWSYDNPPGSTIGNPFKSN